MMKYILCSLIVGILAGYLSSNWGNSAAGNLVSSHMLTFALMLLLFVMGLAFGVDRDSMAKLREAGLRVFVIPFAIAGGSVLGGILSAMVLGINVAATAAACAGYGWYTMAGPLVGQLFGVEWGSISFAVNFLRELLTIIAVSVAVKIDKYAPIAFGGATTMDTTLPVIVRYCGSDVLITAFSSGFVLSILSPLTIIAIASLR